MPDLTAKQLKNVIRLMKKNSIKPLTYKGQEWWVLEAQKGSRLPEFAKLSTRYAHKKFNRPYGTLFFIESDMTNA